LARRTSELLRPGGGEQIPAALMGVHEAITSTTTPRTALNWLRNGAGARLLADIAAGELACTHQALDTHPQARAADYLRHVLVASGGYRQGRGLARLETWVATLIADLTPPEHRRLLHAYANWRVLRRLRRLRRGHPPATPAPSSWPPAAS